MPIGHIDRNPDGSLELQLTYDKVSYAGFNSWRRSFLKPYGGKTLKKFDGPDMRVHVVRLLGQELKLVFRDLPVMTSLIAETPQAVIVLHAIAELEKIENIELDANAR